MRRMAAVAAGVLLAVLLAYATAGAQGTKTVRGTVTTAAPDAVTVKVGDREMTFKVDATTKVTARGGSTATREARAEGKPGVPYTDIIKTGQNVEVAYREPGMLAASIRVVPSVPPPPPTAGTAGRSMNATGVVTALTNSSLTVKGSAGEMTFAIDEKTKVVGRGLGTKSEEMKKAGQKTALTDLVRTGDSVDVRYTDENGTKKASQVQVTRKSTT
jgi:hypothetical protein